VRSAKLDHASAPGKVTTQAGPEFVKKGHPTRASSGRAVDDAHVVAAGVGDVDCVGRSVGCDAVRAAAHTDDRRASRVRGRSGRDPCDCGPVRAENPCHLGGSALLGALGRRLTRAQPAESLQLIDYKIDLCRGRLAAGHADQLWAPKLTFCPACGRRQSLRQHDATYRSTARALTASSVAITIFPPANVV
jgi:hypothetical protein